MNTIIESPTKESSQLISHIGNVAPPTGWEGEQIQVQSSSPLSVVEYYETVVNGSLPFAAKRTEHLINELSSQFGLNVSTAYLNIDNEVAYHAVLLVSQDAYHSPTMQAARILVKEFADTPSKLLIRFSFGVGREHLSANFAGSQYKFKYVHSIEASQPLITSVRRVDNSVGTL